MEAFCKECGDVKEMEAIESGLMCLTCGSEIEDSVVSNSDGYRNYVVGRVASVEPIPKQKDLKKVIVVIKEDDETSVQIVTNAKYVNEGWIVVVALEHAIVPAGAVLDEDANAYVVEKRSVGGIMSFGMICDSPMLGWTGGAKGAVQQLSADEYSVGSRPPTSRPR